MMMGMSEGQGIQKENGTVGKITQKKGCQQGANHAGKVKIGGIQADGTVKGIFSHQFRHERHTGRHVEGIDGAQEEGKKQDPPVGLVACIQQKSQEESLYQVGNLGADEDFPLIVPVNPEAREEGKKEARCKLTGRE